MGFGPKGRIPLKRLSKPLFPRSRLRLAAIVFVTVLLFSLTACGSGSNSFTWFVDDIPANLDPQIASNPADVIACENLYSGLVRKGSDGQLKPALAESWTISNDRRTYTFTIKDGLTYKASKGADTTYTITAEDFVFAFRRLFRSATASPYAVEFSAIENSSAVLAGLQPESSLGVEAADPLTLVFHLSEPDETFLSKLTLPGAMPCDEEFFDSTRGTYGLTSASTLSSGSFYLYNWTASGLFLRRESNGNLVNNLRLVQNTNASGQSAAELIAGEKCSAALDETGAKTNLSNIAYSDTTWSLLFNCDSVFSSTALRQALGSVARETAQSPDENLFVPATGLIPNGLTVDGINYRNTAGDPTPVLPDALSLYREARQGMVNSDFNNVTLLVPAGSGLTQVAEQINGEWQKQFALFFSLEEVDQDEFEKRLSEGDYTIALAPISAESGSVYNVLAQFTTQGGGLANYSNSLYATQLSASTTATGSTRCSLLAECERQLLSDCAAVPLFSQQKRLLIADGIQNLIFDPFGPVLDLTETTVKS